MSKKGTYEQAADSRSAVSSFLNPFFDAWILMLTLGGLSHQLQLPKLALSYWPCVLIVIASICLIPQVNYTNALLLQLVRRLDSEK